MEYVLIIIFFLVAAVVCMVVFRKSKLSEKDKKYVAVKWHELSHAGVRTCIMEADKLLDFCLGKTLGLKYEKVSLGEKLKLTGGVFSDLNGVWFAHKLRNKIAHELDFRVSMGEAKRALAAFKRAFIDLGVKIK
jgi:hypothetical protein